MTHDEPTRHSASKSTPRLGTPSEDTNPAHPQDTMSDSHGDGKEPMTHPLSPNWNDAISARTTDAAPSTEAHTAHIGAQDAQTSRSPLEGLPENAEAIGQQRTAPTTTNNQTLPAGMATGTAAGEHENEALSVRTNMLRSYWEGFSTLTRFRRWILVLRLLIALAQAVAGIVVLALPTSLGDSYSTPETCDPEGMFVYLVLHVTRVVCSIPIDIYLGLSPHRSPRARRRGAEGLLERERNRRVGSLHLDRKMGRLSDLLGFCHIVLFIVGNYVVWTSTECSHAPADSQPLFFTCVAMLSITYLIIVEVALMVFLVIFFLPLLIAILNALGLAHRLPQRDIHPETGKIGQDDIEKHSKLVYYTPLLEESLTDIVEDSTDLNRNGETDGEREAPDGSPSKGIETLHNPASAHAQAVENPQTESSTPRRARIGRLFGLSRHANVSGSGSNKETSRQKRSPQAKANDAEGHDSTSCPMTKYPLYPIPAHRATCPICLSDYEDAKTFFRPEGAAAGAQNRTDGPSSPSVPVDLQDSSKKECSDGDEDAVGEGTGASRLEPLRLLHCGHVMHKACVDQWLTAVSGRCPVCQRPIVEGERTDDQSRPDA